MSEFASLGWSEMGRGNHGYKRGWVHGAIQVWHDGNADMGVHIEASGHGCRELEALEEFQGWPSFLARLLSAGCHVTRLDLAFDDFSDYLDLDRIEGAVRAGNVVSRYKTATPLETISLSDGKKTGRTINFGSRVSETCIRIYEKSLDSLESVEPFGTGVHSHWMRCELELKHDKAQAMAKMLANRETLIGLGGFVLGLVDFKEPGASRQKCRRPTCAWWSDFLASVEKRRLTTAPKTRSIEKSYRWLETQVAPSLAMVVADRSLDTVFDLVNSGKSRWRHWHRSLLETSPNDANS